MQEGPCNYSSCAQTLGQLCSRQSHAGTAPPKPPLKVSSSSRPLSIHPSLLLMLLVPAKKHLTAVPSEGKTPVLRAGNLGWIQRQDRHSFPRAPIPLSLPFSFQQSWNCALWTAAPGVWSQGSPFRVWHCHGRAPFPLLCWDAWEAALDRAGKARECFLGNITWQGISKA